MPNIKEFMKGNDSNRLLKSVKFDIDKYQFVAGVKALGLIAYQITIPLWCTIADKDVHILDSCLYFKEIVEYLEASTEDIESFMSGTNLLSFGHMQSLQTQHI